MVNGGYPLARFEDRKAFSTTKLSAHGRKAPCQATAQSAAFLEHGTDDLARVETATLSESAFCKGRIHRLKFCGILRRCFNELSPRFMQLQHMR
jgi:hypothetical protein